MLINKSWVRYLRQRHKTSLRINYSIAFAIGLGTRDLVVTCSGKAGRDGTRRSGARRGEWSVRGREGCTSYFDLHTINRPNCL